VIAYLIIIFVPYFFFKNYGIISLGISIILSSVEQIIVLSVYLNKYNKVGFSRYSWKIISVGLILLSSSVLLIDYLPVWRFLYCFFCIMTVYFLLSSADKKILFAEIQKKINRKK